MLHDFDKTLENLLINEGKINKRDIDISFEQPTGEWSSQLRRPTLSCWCFDLRENLKLRSMERRVTSNQNMGQVNFPARRIDLTYLVTAWARKVEDEHQLLWRALGTLKRLHKLEPHECEGALRYQQNDIQLFVADMSKPHTNLIDLWSVLDNQMRLGFTLQATVELDTDIGFEAPLVLEASIRVGQAETPADHALSALDVELEHRADEQNNNKDKTQEED
jgi:hypothetical protein